MLNQRKKLAQRLFSGLVGLPPEEPVTSKSVSTVEAPAESPELGSPEVPEQTPTKKRGRPPKGERAMTEVERKRVQRNKEAIEETLAEKNPESKSRLHGERSGEGARKFGMSEIERIIAARERDEDGRRVTPAGPGPTTFEKEATDDSADRGGAFRLPGTQEWKEKQQAEDAKLVRMTVWAFNGTENIRGEVTLNAFCRLCDFQAESPEGAVRHIEEAWFAGLKLQHHLSFLSSPEMVDLVPETMVNEARRRVVRDRHFLALSIVHSERKG